MNRQVIWIGLALLLLSHEGFPEDDSASEERGQYIYIGLVNNGLLEEGAILHEFAKELDVKMAAEGSLKMRLWIEPKHADVMHALIKTLSRVGNHGPIDPVEKVDPAENLNAWWRKLYLE